MGAEAKLILNEFSLIGLVISIVLFFVLQYFHATLLGGF